MPKPCRCAALFELRDYADGISVQYILFSPGMPDGLRQVIEYLPLSQTSAALRSIANHEAFFLYNDWDPASVSGVFFGCCVLVSV